MSTPAANITPAQVQGAIHRLTDRILVLDSRRAGAGWAERHNIEQATADLMWERRELQRWLDARA